MNAQRRLLAGLWLRIEWLLSAAAAPLAVVLMRSGGFEAGVRATTLCICALGFTLFELHHPQQWRAVLFGRRGLELQEAPERVRKLFAEQLATRKLDPARVLLGINASVEVAHSRDVGAFHLVELNPATAAGPTSLLRALFAHELAHVAHNDPLLKRVLCGLLVPVCTLLAALSAGMMEESDAQAFSVAVALLASATLLPWAYAVLQAVSFAMELRADREAAALCGAAGPVFELLDCLDDGGQPYRLQRSPVARGPELVERETNRLLEELLNLLPAHPPTFERRRRLLSLQRGASTAGFWRGALPQLAWATGPVVAALLFGAAAFQLVGPQQWKPLRRHRAPIAHLDHDARVPPVAHPDASFPLSPESEPVKNADSR
jgi:hypothetical protein